MNDPKTSRLLPRLALALGGIVGFAGPALPADQTSQKPVPLSNPMKAALLEAVVADHMPALAIYSLVNKIPRDKFVAGTAGADRQEVAGESYNKLKEFGDTVFGIAAKGTDATPAARVRDTIALAENIDKVVTNLRSLSATGRLDAQKDTTGDKTQVVTVMTFLAVDGMGRDLMPLFNPILPDDQRAAARAELTSQMADDIMSKNSVPKWNRGDARPVVRSDVTRVMKDLGEVQAGISTILRKGTAAVSISEADTLLAKPFGDIPKAFDRAAKDAKGFQNRIAYGVPEGQAGKGYSSITITYGKGRVAKSLVP